MLVDVRDDVLVALLGQGCLLAVGESSVGDVLDEVRDDLSPMLRSTTQTIAMSMSRVMSGISTE